MRYVIQGTYWGFGKDFRIDNESGECAFVVHCARFSWSRALSIRDVEGRELAVVAKEFWRFRTRYVLHREGAKFGEFTHPFTWFRNRFILDVPGPSGYTIEGSLLNRAFVFVRGETGVATATLP